MSQNPRRFLTMDATTCAVALASCEHALKNPQSDEHRAWLENEIRDLKRAIELLSIRAVRPRRAAR